MWWVGKIRYSMRAWSCVSRASRKEEVKEEKGREELLPFLLFAPPSMTAINLETTHEDTISPPPPPPPPLCCTRCTYSASTLNTHPHTAQPNRKGPSWKTVKNTQLNNKTEPHRLKDNDHGLLKPSNSHKSTSSMSASSISLSGTSCCCCCCPCWPWWLGSANTTCGAAGATGATTGAAGATGAGGAGGMMGTTAFAAAPTAGAAPAPAPSPAPGPCWYSTIGTSSCCGGRGGGCGG